MAQKDTTTLQMATKQKKKSGLILRARVEPALKSRVAEYCTAAERSESFVVRTAVKELLDRAKEDKKAA